MQGLQALDQFKDFVSKIGGLGRYEDTYIVHAAEGETVVPMEVLDQNPVLKKRLFKTMMEMGIEPGRYIVGNELNSKNPVTGQPEFFLKKIVSQIRKALPGDSEKYLGTIVGLATGNPYLGAIAGGVGSGMEGAIGGGLTGFQSPGIQGLGGGFRDVLGGDTLFGRDKVSAMKFGDIIKDRAGLSRFFLGEGDQSGLIGKGGKLFGGGDGGKVIPEGSTTSSETLVKAFDEAVKVGDFSKAADIKALLGSEASKSGMSLFDYLKAIGVGGLILQQFEDDGDIGEKYTYTPTGETYGGVINQRPIFAQGRAEGGVMDLQDGGESVGPGTGTSDSIPAMLSDGEFVMTAKAVRGAGGGDRREGARKMYEAMDRLEAKG
jgi:hypothetical protein